MKLIISLNRKERLYDYVSMGIDCFILGGQYSFYAPSYFSLDDISQMVKQYPQCSFYVAVNALYDEHEIEAVEAYIDALSKMAIHGILFQDFGVLQICNEHNFDFEMIYHPDTLNTNQATLNYLGTQGINGAFLAREIPLEEKKIIAKNVNVKTMIQVHGVEYMAYSKRKLLTNYFKEINQDIPIGISDDLTIQANGVNYSCHIYEDQYGCHILSKQQMCGLDIMSSFQDFDYLYIESLYVDELKLVEIVNLYQDALISVGNRTYGINIATLSTGSKYRISS